MLAKLVSLEPGESLLFIEADREPPSPVRIGFWADGRWDLATPLIGDRRTCIRRNLDPSEADDETVRRIAIETESRSFGAIVDLCHTLRRNAFVRGGERVEPEDIETWIRRESGVRRAA